MYLGEIVSDEVDLVKVFTVSAVLFGFQLFFKKLGPKFILNSFFQTLLEKWKVTSTLSLQHSS